MHKIEGAHFQCVNNHDEKFEYKGIKTTGATDYINQITPRHFGWKKCLRSTALKIRKYLSNVHKIEGVHCMNNHYAMFEYNGMKAV